MNKSTHSDRYPRIRLLLWLMAALLTVPAALPAQPETLPGANPPEGLPKGAIVAFVPDARSQSYSDLAGLKRWLRIRGWAICDGTEGTPDLNYRMLLGTVHPEETGQNLGSRTHDHSVSGDAASAFGRDHHIRSGLGRVRRIPAQGHKHKVEARTAQAEHLPLSLRVLYIMKTR
jgi:hypothetical protein